jgi:hypothetical protein
VIQAKLFLCADSAAIDARNNALSAFNIIEQFSAASFPVAVPRIAMIAAFTREQTDPSNIQFQLKIFAGNQQLFGGPFAVNFVQQLTARTVAEMHGLVIPGPGNLTFVLMNGEEKLSSWTVTVNQVGQAPLQMFLPPTQAPQGSPLQ